MNLETFWPNLISFWFLMAKHVPHWGPLWLQACWYILIIHCISLSVSAYQMVKSPDKTVLPIIDLCIRGVRNFSGQGGGVSHEKNILLCTVVFLKNITPIKISEILCTLATLGNGRQEQSQLRAHVLIYRFWLRKFRHCNYTPVIIWQCECRQAYLQAEMTFA